MKPLTLAVLGFWAAAIGVACPSWAGEPLVVHEWGVVFISSATGQIPFQPPKSEIAQLPDYVIRHSDRLYPHYGIHKKPVIYFYGDENLRVNVELGMPQGKPLAYWPRPEQYLEDNTDRDEESQESQLVGISWNGTLHQAAPDDLPVAPDGSWWGEARKVPAMYFRSVIPLWGTERFIFYEATARPENTITEELTADRLTLSNHGDKPSGTILLIINDGDRPHLTVLPAIEEGGHVLLDRKTLMSAGGDDKQVLDACKKQWVEFGMTAAEADAIVAIWQKEILSMRGFLVLRRIPAAVYDQIFPLNITPKPDQQVRVSMVFDALPGRSERLEWLPELKASIEKWGRQLGDDDSAVRQSASEKLAAADDLAKPMLEKLAESPDPEVRTRAEGLLGRFDPPLVAAPATRSTTQKSE